jgi:hypothetical protein
MNVIRCFDALAKIDTLVPLILEAYNEGVVLYGADELGIWVSLENPTSADVLSRGKTPL